MRKVWRAEGTKGFYRGLTASYAGIVETVIYFVIYEQFKVRQGIFIITFLCCFCKSLLSTFCGGNYGEQAKSIKNKRL